MPVKVLDSSGNGSDASVASGITWAADHGAKIISLSLGASSTSTTMNNAAQYAWNKGCLIVAAAGNSGSSALFYPAASPNVLSVAATDSSDTLAGFSNYGSWVQVAAPGVSIYSTTPTYANSFGLNYAWASGTSMATPHVAGEAALLLAQRPTLTNVQLKNLIVSNVDTYKPVSGHTIATGAGRINVLRALQAVSTIAPITRVPIADSYVRSGAYADQNAGSEYLLMTKNAPADWTRVSYLKFDLTGVQYVPVSAHLTLTLYGSQYPAGVNAPLKVYGVADTSWTETGITWNNAPGLDRTTTRGTGTLLQSLTILSTATVVDVDVTSYLQANVGKIITLQLINEVADGYGLNFLTRETKIGGAPTLTLTF